jgi:two-component system, cell cycle sensor histidine kinase and response regulator CckA
VAGERLSGEARQAGRLLLVVLASIGAAVLCALTVAGWRQQASQSRDAERSWHEVEVGVAQLDALQWQMFAAGATRKLQVRLRRMEGTLDGALARAARTPARPADARRAVGLFERRRVAVERERRLAAAGRREDARRVQRKDVQPLAAPLGRSLRAVADGYRERADAAGRRADAGVLAAILGAAVLVAALFLRTARARQRAEAELARRDVQARLEQGQRLESVGRLAGGIAHDFNNILGVILNSAGFLETDLPEGPARDDAREIREAAERGGGLTRQLLLFSRHQEAEPEKLDIDGVVGGIEQMLRRLLGEHVELSLRCATGETVEADRGQLEQVLVNLAINARDAMPRGGTIKVTTRSVELNREGAGAVGLGPGRYVGLAVADDGEGMDDETAARAFDPFFSTKREGEGTGLGLATVYGIVTRAGGHIELRSRTGRGTVVDILLPAVGSSPVQAAAAPPAVLPVAAPEPGPAHTGRTVLLVEDDAALRDTTVRVLEGGGHRVLQAADAETALVLLREAGSVDVVVSDVVLPGMSGVDLAARVEARRPGAPRVVLVSGYTDDVAMRADGTGGRPVLDKPFTAEQLLGAVAGDDRPPATLAAGG